MKSLFETDAYGEVIDRLNQLEASSPASWGKMNVAQMLAHCKKPLEVALGHREFAKPNALVRLLMRAYRPAMYNDKLWRPGMKTAPSYRVTTPKVFSEEMTGLKALIDEMHQAKPQFESKTHPAFGNLSQTQWGQMQYKHLDHHLRQFGV